MNKLEIFQEKNKKLDEITALIQEMKAKGDAASVPASPDISNCSGNPNERTKN